MQNEVKPRLPIAAAVAAFAAAAVFLVLAAMISFIAGFPPSAWRVSLSLLPFPLSFAVGGALLARRCYSNRSLGGASLCLSTMAATVCWTLAPSSWFTASNLGWNSLLLMLPLSALVFVVYPLLLVLAGIVFFLSAKETLFSGRGNPNKSVPIAIIVLTASILVACVALGAYQLGKDAQQSEDLEEYLESSQAGYEAWHSDLFSQSLFPSRGFSLENYYDVSRDDSTGVFEYFYRSKATGLSWRLYEDGGKLVACLSNVTDDSEPLSAVDEFVLVERGGDYELAYMFAGHGGTLHHGDIAAIVDRIDAGTLDSYTPDRIIAIADGTESHEPVPSR